jgi:hypothetical protein
MALPTTTYDTANVANPDTDLTDFSLLVDLSRMSAAWWSAVNTSDGARGRAAKDDGTELATDWIDFDDTAETGWLRVKWSGTLAASGTQTLRVYPPVTGNPSLAASDTYGSDNAYNSDFIIYYPDAGGADRTSNGNDALSYVGGITAGAATGKTGSATEWDGNNDSIYLPRLLELATAYTIMVWINVDTAGDSGIFWIGNHGAGRPIGMWFDENGVNDRLAFLQTDSGGLYSGVKYSANGSLSTGTWYHVAIRFNAGATPSPKMDMWVNGVLSSFTVAGLDNVDDTAALAYGLGGVGSANQIFDGRMCEFFMSDQIVPMDAIELEYEQGNDQAAFWGTWTNNPATSTRRVHYIM